MAIGKRAGVYQPVATYYTLSGHKQMGGTRVAILKGCEHAVIITNRGDKKDPATRYCDLCSRAEKRKELEAEVKPARAPTSSGMSEIARVLSEMNATVARLDARLTQVEDAKTTPTTPPSLTVAG
jgi:hypothetical protein